MVGSSPLARGLPRSDDRGVVGSGIIPARAGFTSFCPITCVSKADHPRSRGVYSVVLWPRAARAGSSPLARGLRDTGRRPAREHRIIPARAGFTSVSIMCSFWFGDHPRSRGVYSVVLASANSPGGSSPLARGLLRGGVEVGLEDGIIPARAGFTTMRAIGMTRGRDHPRSRGVYILGLCPTRAPHGSSPLARGLLLTTRARGLLGRIIPARAGFTPVSRPGRGWVGDHPRSRGVYGVTGLGVEEEGGSSPLARGLRRTVSHSTRTGRIIPARAGFTCCSLFLFSLVWDHPRSRGVYCFRAALFSFLAGSSPLARGLLRDGPVRTRCRGIIPARAGFTPCPRCFRSISLDHPRSRGVYLCAGGTPEVDTGSSPLARGLRSPCPGRCADTRIIPARAGFTAAILPRPVDDTDHPRSRGVYPGLL